MTAASRKKGEVLARTLAGNAFIDDLDAVIAEIRDLLIAKNKAYGDSALSPVRVFSKADPLEQIAVRIDDKLSRLMRGSAQATAIASEDTVQDLLGYLLLYKIAKRRSESTEAGPVADEQARPTSNDNVELEVTD